MINLLQKPARVFIHAVVILNCAAGIPRSHASEAHPQYEVGVSKIDITPTYTIRLNGFGHRRTESEGITQRIWAKALAFGADDEKPVVLITIDSLGVRLPMVDEVAARLQAKAGVERARLAITFTHSHTTPKLNGVCDTIFSTPIPPEHQAHIDRYAKELTDALEQVALAALKDRKPARLSWATGQVGFAKNRRTPGGPVDHALPMLVVSSPDDGAIRAIYVTYACHCVTLSNNLISGDWAGYAQEAMERAHPGAVALVSIGCGSDSNPDSGVTVDNTAAAADQGDQIAHEVERLLQGELKPVTGPIDATLDQIDLPLNKPPTREELEALARQEGAAAYNAQFQLAKLDRGESLQTSIDYPVQTWSFGDSLAMVFLAGEVCVDYSLRLKQELDAGRLWVHGYSNDFCSYIPSERLLREGGYGGGAEIVYFALPTTLAPGLEEKIIDEVHRQVPQEFHGADVDAGADAASPEAAIGQMRCKESLVVELAAAEPLLGSPVAIDFGPDGRLWVAEMPDYSRDVDDQFEQSGRVKALVDRDGDGRFDEATVLAGGLRFPTDVKVWGKGVIVCDAPDVIYLEDTDGDGAADLRKTLLAGFSTDNAQARVNSLRWGLDNWLYGSCGILGGQIKSFNGSELALGGRDFRFRPDTGEIQAVTGSTQQGRTCDDWGNWFGCTNGTLLKHYPLADHYLARNPHIPPAATEFFVPQGDAPNLLYPIGEPTLYKLSGPPGRPTSVCGAEIYRDELLGREYRGNAFVAEPVNQLVHRLSISPHGGTFAGDRPADERKREFLASTENRFRPVQIRTGLDGCLWVVDMHRAVIEHPKFIPAESLQGIDLMAGRAEGRIYRIRPRDRPPRPSMRLDQLDAAGLVAALDSPNGPQRDLAHQMLVAKADAGVALQLESLVNSSDRSETRLHALCTLDGLGALRPEIVACALADAHSGVRRHAVRLAEPFLNESPEIGDALLRLVDDKDPQVQLQLAYSLGEWDEPQADAAIARLAWTWHADPYILSAAWSSVNKRNAGRVVEGVLRRNAERELPEPLIQPVAKLAITLADAASLRDALRAMTRPKDGAYAAWQLRSLADFLELLLDAKSNPFVDDQQFASQMKGVLAAARTIAGDAAAAPDSRLVAVRLLSAGDSNQEDAFRAAAALLAPQCSPKVQQAAMKIMVGADAAGAADALLEHWTSYSPGMRSQVLAVFAEREAMAPILLDKIGQGALRADSVDAATRQRLLTHPKKEIRDRATAAFSGPLDADRNSVLQRYADIGRLRADAAHGREVFAKHCASCHRLDEQGHDVGPDLAALTSRSSSAQLEAIFDPNRTVDQRYQSYIAVGEDGLAHTGILLRETATSITLLEQQGKEHTLLRSELEAFQNTGASLMPVGFEKDLAPQDAADLLAFLASQGTPAKPFPGNKPEVVKADRDGAVWLLATNGGIHGQEIAFEAPFKNVGFWRAETDHVAWDVELENDRSFDAYLHWACAADSAGNSAIVDGFETPLRTVIESTGSYDDYETKKIGRVRLLSGRSRVVLRPDGPLVRPNLMDLRGLYLVPEGGSAERALAGVPPGALDAAAEIQQLVAGLEVGTAAEYERIPTIWEHAIAAGRRNNADELIRVLAVALPKPEEPLRDWQVVVVGGGGINGLSAACHWPGRRIAEILQGHAPLLARWDRALKLAAAMADNESVRAGTRYDALRMVGMEPFVRGGKQLIKYLGRDAGHELQMGAVSGLSDMQDDAVAAELISAFDHLHESNRVLAVDALLRTDARAAALSRALDAGQISRQALTRAQSDRLAQMLGKPSPPASR